MEHYYILPSGEVAENMKTARTILGIGTHKFRLFVKTGIVIKVDVNLNDFQNVKTLISQSNEEQNHLQQVNAR